MSLALVTPEQVLCSEVEGGAKASCALIPGLLGLLAQAGCALSSLDAIAYGRGPGAFTGLRTACSVAQGLAYGAGKPVVALDSLMLVAESVRSLLPSLGLRTVWVAQDARMDEIYAAAYRWEGSAGQDVDRSPRWQPVVPPALYSIQALNQRWGNWHDLAPVGAGFGVVGSALSVLGDRLDSGRGVRLDTGQGIGRARALATLAAAGWEDGALLDAAQALPLYLRDKVALTSDEREAMRAAKEGA